MKKRLLVAVMSVCALMIAGGVIAVSQRGYGRVTLPPQYYQAQKSPSVSSVPNLDHVVIIVEENKPRQSIIGNPAAPYLNQLAHDYAYGVNYYAVTNPSLPNYIALTSGTTAGITNDCSAPSDSCQADVASLADRLERAHKTWKMYAEGMPKPCYASNRGNYAVKHNPFLYYPDITSNTSRCKAHVVPLGTFIHDLASATGPPNFAFISPDLCNDMHNCSIATGDKWLENNVPKILQSPAFMKQHSLLVIVWDEGNSSNNNVLVIFVGSAAKQGYISERYYSHYSLLHTIEQAWKLTPLTQNDRGAPLMTDMLR